MSRPVRAELLDLAPHPEGGWYRRTWTSPAELDTPRGPRAAASLIHYLLEDGDASAWHLVHSDEIWLWHGPGILVLQSGGTGAGPEPGATVTLGTRLEAGEQPQAVIPAGTWQRSLPASGEVLVSCLVSPEFRFDDWQLDG